MVENDTLAIFACCLECRNRCAYKNHKHKSQHSTSFYISPTNKPKPHKSFFWLRLREGNNRAGKTAAIGIAEELLLEPFVSVVLAFGVGCSAAGTFLFFFAPIFADLSPKDTSMP
jgi:hypothetical protein